MAVGLAVPFLLAIIALGITVPIFAAQLLRFHWAPPPASTVHSAGQVAAELGRLLIEQPRLRFFLAANALWELALAALKTFVVLYITAGLHHSLRTASLVIGLGAVFVLIAAGFSGRLADRFGVSRVVYGALVIYAPGLLIPFLTRNTAVLDAIVPLVAIGGGVLMTLPYAILIPLMPSDEHGALTGFYSLTRGLGTLLGPLIAGVAIQIFKAPLSGTGGYQAMWLVCSLSTAISIPLTHRLLRDQSVR